MIMSDDKKKGGIAALIIKGMGKGAPMEKPETNESGDEVDRMGYDTAVDEMFDAIENKDKAKFKEALKSFVNMCDDEEDSEEDEEGEEE